MCGLSGFWSPRGGPLDGEQVLRRMADSLRHRGPDDEEIWRDAAAGVGLSFRRLAILDLTIEGRQPMCSRTGRYVIVFNGEVYNFLELRAQLRQAGADFRGGSDTEVMLEAIERWGVAGAVRRFAGMFAFALWDRVDRKVYLGRDRLGEKPLYYGTVDGTLVFGSELKALRAFPGWRGTIDHDALALYLRHSYVPAPYSIYAGVRKVSPGTIVGFHLASERLVEAEEVYWSALDAMQAGLRAPAEGSEGDLIDECDALLRTVVAREMIADVPLGAFLSGGVDSSTIVAMMQAQSSRPVETFTIGFREPAYDEAGPAREVATRLGTRHTELYVSDADMLAAAPCMPGVYDEPFGDPSQIPTFLVARLARQRVTVSLSGDGGDELFGGYTHYLHARKLWRAMHRVPRSARNLSAATAMTIPSGVWDRLISRGGDRVSQMTALLRADSLETMYRGVMSHCRRPQEFMIEAREPATAFSGVRPGLGSPIERMMYLDLVTFLPDDVLAKVDRATMSVSLESRAPLLDHTVAEFAWRVPFHMKVRGGRGKWLLRQVLRRYIPEELVDRPKMGFGVPIENWLVGPLREWAGDLLSPSRVKRDGLFRPEAVSRLWERQQSGASRREHVLWSLLMLHGWMDRQ